MQGWPWMFIFGTGLDYLAAVLLVGWEVSSRFYAKKRARSPTKGVNGVSVGIAGGPAVWLRELFAGALTAIGMLLDCIGIVAILFMRPSLEPLMGVAFNQVLFGQLVAQMVTVAMSGYSTPVVASCFEILPYIKEISEDVQVECKRISTLDESVSTPQCVATTLFWATAGISLGSGVLMYLAARMKLSVFLRFLPNPLKMGVQAGLGVICISLGIELCCENNVLEMDNPLDLFTDSSILMLWMPGMLSALGLYFFGKYVSESALTIPVFFIVGTVGCQYILFSSGHTKEEAIDAGWLYAPLAPAEFYTFWQSLFAWVQPGGAVAGAALRDNYDNLALAILTGPILNTLGDLAVTNTIFDAKELGHADFNNELKVQGLAHIASGLGGSYPSDFGNDGTLLHRVGGGKTRLSMVLSCCLLGAIMVISSPTVPIVPTVVSEIPKFLNGATLLLASFDMLLDPIRDGYRELPKSEYAVVWVVIIMTIWSHGAIDSGLILGLILAFAVFVYHQTGALHLHTVCLRSRAVWPAACERALSKHKIFVADILGDLFFANAEAMTDSLLTGLRDCIDLPSALVIDLTNVRTVDATAGDELLRLVEGCAERGVKTYFVVPIFRSALILSNKGVVSSPLRLKRAFPEHFNEVDATTPATFSKEQFLALCAAAPDAFSSTDEMDAVWEELVTDDDGRISEFELAFAFRELFPESDSDDDNVISDDEDSASSDSICGRLATTRERAIQAAEQGTLVALGFDVVARGKLVDDVSTTEAALPILQHAALSPRQREIFEAFLAPGGGGRLRGLCAGESADLGHTTDLLVLVEGSVDIFVHNKVNDAFTVHGGSGDSDLSAASALSRFVNIRRQMVPLDFFIHELGLHGEKCDLVLVADGPVLLLEVQNGSIKALEATDPQAAIQLEHFLLKRRSEVQRHIGSRYVMLQNIRNLRSVTNVDTYSESEAGNETTDGSE